MNLFRNDLAEAAQWVQDRLRKSEGPITVHILGNGEVLTRLARTDRLPVTSTTYMACYAGDVRYSHIVADLREFREERIARNTPAKFRTEIPA